MYELKDKKETVLKTKVNIKRLKAYKCSSEQNDLHAIMNKVADAESVDNDEAETDSRNEVSEGISDKVERMKALI